MPALSSSRHLLIPFAHHGSPACREALTGLRLPKLEALLTRLALVSEDIQDETTLSPPHERALAQAIGITAADGCIPWAALEAHETGLPADSASWAIATLCHWQVGIDDVVLGAPIDIDAAESAALLAVARPFFAEDDITLHASSTPGRWLACGKIFDGLACASIDRAVGHPISQWSPLSAAARPLRRLQNEMQMLLYTHRVNDERERRGAPPINSFWLSGAGRLPQHPSVNPYPFIRSLSKCAPVSTSPARTDEGCFLIAHALRAPALRDDGAAWVAAWRTLDDGPIAELLAAAERDAAVSLTLCGDRGARRFEWRPRGLAGWTKSLFRRPNTTAVLEVL